MNIVERAKNIIMTPKTEWSVIAGEQPNIAQIVTNYVIPLALVPTIAMVLGYALFKNLATYGIAMAIVTLLTTVLGVFITAFVVNFLAPNFGSQKNLGRAVQLVSYSYTPAWVAGILYIVPVLSALVWVGSLYALYLIYVGLPHTMKTPQDKVVVYLVVTIIVLMIVYFVILAILTTIVLGIFGLSALTLVG